MRLEYKFEAPTGTEDSLTYEARPVHRTTGTSVAIAQLSSGEKTLMAVAMSLYAGSRLGEAIDLPQVLLLDEADASLHPSMVQSLLRVGDDIFSKQYGVKVILTTHAPSTVALAPEEALYTMRMAGRPRLRRATRDQALSSLTVGIPTLSVRIENRRQVFTESDYDAACYHDLFGHLAHRLGSEVSLEFIASGIGDAGGSEAVKFLVTKLRNAGNRLVWGVVDRDNREGAPPGIVYVAGRHSLENLVLDPLVVGVFLLRERIVQSTEVGFPETLRHFELTERHAQQLADFVVRRVQHANDDTDLVTVSYLGGFNISVARFYLDTQGHSIEERLKAAFPPLMSHKKGLKSKVIERAIKDVPQYTPVDVVTLFNDILTAAV